MKSINDAISILKDPRASKDAKELAEQVIRDLAGRGVAPMPLPLPVRPAPYDYDPWRTRPPYERFPEPPYRWDALNRQEMPHANRATPQRLFQ